MIKKIIDDFKDNFAFSISHTTRKPRTNEVDGVNYYYVTVDDFKEMISNEEFIEYNVYGSNYYGTSKKELKRLADYNKICILELDINGANNIVKSQLGANFIGILPPCMDVLKKRLKDRNTESEEVINKRLEDGERECGEINASTFFNYKIINDDLNSAYDSFRDACINLYPHINKI